MTTVSSASLGELAREYPQGRVRFSCHGCGAAREAPLPQVIAQLIAQGVGDEETDIHDAGLFAERPCHRCGDMRWETRLVVHSLG